MRIALHLFGLATIWAATIATAAHPSDLATAKAHRVAPSFGSMVRVLVQITNTTTRPLAAIYVNCTVFNGQNKPIGVGRWMAENLKSGETDYTEFNVVVSPDDPKSASAASCRVEDVRESD